MRVLQIANYSERGGGISVQVRLIRDHLAAGGTACDIVSTKGPFRDRMTAIGRLLFKGRRYDVFHVHACSGKGFFPAVVGIGIGRLLRRRIVFTYHGGGAEAFFLRKTRLVRFFISRTDVNVVLSEFIGKIYRQYGFPYTVIPNIVELKETYFRERETIKPRFVSIRSFYDIYNIECTLRAFRKVKMTFPDASLLLLGVGPLRKDLECFVREQQIKDVTFVGKVQNEDIYQYLAQTDIMVSSSRFDNMPVSVLEGFNAGLLVIASRVGGVPYMIRDGENGLLFEDDNDDDLARKMEYALENPDKVREMITCARQDLKHYSWDDCRSQLMRVYIGE